jgi:glutamyl-tRNA synthetase
MTADEVYNKTLSWAEIYDKEFADLIKKYESYTKQVLNIERNTEKPRKDIGIWSDVKDCISIFYSELFDKSSSYEMPERLSSEDVKEVLGEYLKEHNVEVDKDTWFESLKVMAEKLGYSKDMKSFKKNPEAFKGNIGDVAMSLRVALTKRRNTPDLYESMKVMGKEMVFDRLNMCIKSL